MLNHMEKVIAIMYDRKADLVCGPSGWYLNIEDLPRVSEEAAVALMENNMVILCDTRRGIYRLSIDGIEQAQHIQGSRRFLWAAAAAVAVGVVLYLIARILVM